jgi:beta-glucosidase/6-phospho-beta-glucosidase/beta-galactosidase
VIDDFVAYSKILFERLGDRVKHWITINEVGFYLGWADTEHLADNQPHIFTFLQSLAWKADKWDYERDMPK